MTDKTGTKREATFAATRRLRDAHPEEFAKLLVEEYEKRGIPVPKSREQKARETMAKLLAEHPQVVYEAVDTARNGEQD